AWGAARRQGPAVAGRALPRASLAGISRPEWAWLPLAGCCRSAGLARDWLGRLAASTTVGRCLRRPDRPPVVEGTANSAVSVARRSIARSPSARASGAAPPRFQFHSPRRRGHGSTSWRAVRELAADLRT